MIGIYSITNLINGKRYIGKSINLNGRLSSHKCSLRKDVRNKDTNRYLFNAVKKYGIENFNFEVIELDLSFNSYISKNSLTLYLLKILSNLLSIYFVSTYHSPLSHHKFLILLQAYLTSFRPYSSLTLKIYFISITNQDAESHYQLAHSIYQHQH